MKRSVMMMAIALAFAAAPLAAAESFGLDQAYAAALRQSESLASQQELVLQAEERYKQAVGDVLPSVNANALWFLEDSRGLPTGPGEATPQQTTSRAQR